MLILENIGLALIAIRANATRSILTMLGIIIGVASVIGIMTIGDAIGGEVDGLLADGISDISIGVAEKSDEDDMMPMAFMRPERDKSDSDYITDDMINDVLHKFGSQLDGVKLNLKVSDECSAIHEGKTANVSITGDNKKSLEADKLEIIAGREFYDDDYNSERKICLVSQKLVDAIYSGDYKSVIDAPLSILNNNVYITYTIVGVYKEEASESYGGMDFEESSYVYIPLRALMYQLHRYDRYDQVVFVAKDYATCDELADKITKYINKKYYSKNQFFEVDSFTMASMITSAMDMINKIRLGLAAIAGISLLVGGIGVMNIMLVSITERTREIGTRKALGATNASIRTQFIVESIVLCLVGGLIGMALGAFLGYVGCKAMETNFVLLPRSVIIALSFSAAVGIFFGYYPADKAARMNPIDALRYE